MFIRVYGDIEDNEQLQYYIIKYFYKPLYKSRHSIFLGDILSPNYGVINNIKFFVNLMSKINLQGISRTSEFTTSIDSFHNLLCSMTNNKDEINIETHDWKKNNYRSKLTKEMNLIGYTNEMKQYPFFMFILGNKEVQTCVDIYNSLINNTCKYNDEILKIIYDYLNHCVDYIIIKDNLFIHSYENRNVIDNNYNYVISGHSRKYIICENFSIIDTSNTIDKRKFINFFKI